MRFIEEFNSESAVLPILQQLKDEVEEGRTYRIMEFCGGHTHSFLKSGLVDALPSCIELIHGPGCPVCVLPSDPLCACIELMDARSDICLATYADLMRVHIKDGESLLEAKARGLDIVPIYSPNEALSLAKSRPDKKVIFLAIGFETTIPPTVVTLKKTVEEGVDNFFIYCNHLNTAMALKGVIENEARGGPLIQGFIGPGHVSLVTGAELFSEMAKAYHKPIVVAGFTAYDLALSLLMLVKQINRNQAKVEIEYTRAVSFAGNKRSMELISKYLCLRPTYKWRGMGELADSAFAIKDQYRSWDAEYAFNLQAHRVEQSLECICEAVLTGAKKPLQCQFFGVSCTPQSPKGPCMASAEGACSAYFQSGRHLNKQTKVESQWMI